MARFRLTLTPLTSNISSTCRRAMVLLACCCWLAATYHSTADARTVVKRQADNGNLSIPIQIGDIVGLLGPRNEVDLVALLQRNQGISKRNFYTKIRPLVESIITQYATIHPRYVRSAAVTFSRSVTVAYDHISSGGSDAVTKCDLFGGEDPVWNKVVFRNDDIVGVNIRDALSVVIDILTKGKQNRPNVTQVIMVVSDGDFGTEYDPLQYIPKLQTEMNVQMFAAGLGVWLKPISLSVLASKVSYYAADSNWNNLIMQNASSVGSDANPLWAPTSGAGVCAYYGSNCTDDNSLCYCDVDRGVADCRCREGYAQLQPLQSTFPAPASVQCQACPSGSYRGDQDDDQTCLPCSSAFGTGSGNTVFTPELNVTGCDCQDGNCTSDPCAESSNATCSANEVCLVNASTGGATCSCLSGWTSPSCSVNRDDCTASTPRCKNGGRCYDKVDTVECVCPFGYRGSACEIELDYCTFDICVDNNTVSCDGWQNNFRCVCRYGWAGDFCEDIDPKATLPSTTSTSLPPTSSSSPLSAAVSSSDPRNQSTTSSYSVTVQGVTDANSSSPVSNAQRSYDDRANVIIIIVIVCVVGGALLLVLLVVIIAMVMTRRKRREAEKKQAAAAAAAGVGRDSFHTPRPYGVRSTTNRFSRSISSRFSGLWKKWTVRAHDPNDWYNAGGVPSVPKTRAGLHDVSDPQAVDIDETIVKNEEIIVEDRLNGWNSYLHDLEKSGVILSGIIAETDAHEFAKTKTWALDWPELESLERVMDGRKTQFDVHAQGATYRIHSNDGTLAIGHGVSNTPDESVSESASSSSFLSSSSSAAAAAGTVKTLAIGVTKSYLIAGVTTGETGQFQKELQWIVDHISAEGY